MKIVISRTGKSDAQYIADLEKELFNKENPVKEVFNSEPVAWIYERPDGSAKLVWVREPHDKSIIKEIPLYTAPQTESRIIKEMNETYADLKQSLQTKPLSDEEILKIAEKMFHYTEYKLAIEFARIVRGEK